MPKITISPAQALLILIEKYKGQAADYNTLVSFYLNGIKNPLEKTSFNRYIQKNKDLFQNYQINPDFKVINNDPTRRYFETNLAYTSLSEDTDLVSNDDLMTYVRNLESYLNFYDPDRYSECFKVLEGEYSKTDSVFHQEYGEIIRRLKRKGKLFSDIDSFDDDKRLKLQLIVRASFLAVNCAQSELIRKYAPMPFDIYDTGFFRATEKGKAELPLNEIQNVRNRHNGLMKGHMPVTRDDPAFSTATIPHIKATDKSIYDINASWIKTCAMSLVHPFSNAISGHILCQLRALAYFQANNAPVFIESRNKFTGFFKTYISTMLFYTGGHSLFEFVYPLCLAQVNHQFQLNFNINNISDVFNDKQILDKTITKTIDYNRALLQWQALHQEIKEASLPESKSAFTLLKAKKFSLNILNDLELYNREVQLSPLTLITNNYEPLLNQFKQYLENNQYAEALKVGKQIPGEVQENGIPSISFTDLLQKVTLLHDYYSDYTQRLSFLGAPNPEVSMVEGNPENGSVDKKENEKLPAVIKLAI